MKAALLAAVLLGASIVHGAPVTANLTMWLDAADLGTITMDGSNRVSQWKDKSGNDYHAVQIEVAEQPTYFSSAIGGKAAIQFATADVGAEQRYLTTSGTTAQLFTRTAGSIFVVFKPSGIDDKYEYLMTMPRQSSLAAFLVVAVDGYWSHDSNSFLNDVGDFSFFVRNTGSGVSFRSALNSDVLDNGGNYIGAMSYSSSQIALATSEGSHAANTLSPTAWTSGDYAGRIGAGTVAADMFRGYVAEILTYNRTLNDAERVITDNYLSSKYGISLAGNDYYSGETGINGDSGLAFDGEVFGIGRMADGSSQLLASPSTQGVGVKAASLADGTWLLAGHNGAEHGWMDDGGIERWNRVWCVDVTYEQGSLSTFDLAFDFDAAGLAIGSGVRYGLLFRENDVDDWTVLPTDYTIDGNRLVFSSISLGDTLPGAADGYYTLGIVPEPGSFVLTCLMLLGFLGRGAVRFRR